jgi:hypothetical protein
VLFNGTPNVAVSNTPSVTLSGTPSVAVSGTPTVAVSSVADGALSGPVFGAEFMDWDLLGPLLAAVIGLWAMAWLFVVARKVL